MKVVLELQGKTKRYQFSYEVVRYELYEKANGKPTLVQQPVVDGLLAEGIRSRKFEVIHVLLKGGQ